MSALGFLWTSFIGSVASVIRQERTRAIGLALIGLLATGTIFYSLVEGWSPLDSLYFSVTTLATVGYGDFAPTTGLGKIFTIFFVLAGVGVVVAFASEVARQTINRTTEGVEERMARRRQKELTPEEDAPEEAGPR
ncbi:MAG TPA: potassium channel family protein [Candidatus Limnocylindria bacterium]